MVYMRCMKNNLAMPPPCLFVLFLYMLLAVYDCKGVDNSIAVFVKNTCRRAWRTQNTSWRLKVRRRLASVSASASNTSMLPICARFRTLVANIYLQIIVCAHGKKSKPYCVRSTHQASMFNNIIIIYHHPAVPHPHSGPSTNARRPSLLFGR